MTEEQMTANNFFDSFVEYVKQALQIVQLDTAAIDEAARDENAFSMGLAVLAVAGIALSIGTFNPFGVVAFPVFYVVGAFIGAGILHLIATLAFGGEGDFMAFFRPLSLAYVLLWVNVIPWLGVALLGWIASLWLLAVLVVVIERVYGLERPKAIATVAIPAVAMFLIAVVFGTLLFSLLLVLGMS